MPLQNMMSLRILGRRGWMLSVAALSPSMALAVPQQPTPQLVAAANLSGNHSAFRIDTTADMTADGVRDVVVTRRSVTTSAPQLGQVTVLSGVGLGTLQTTSGSASGQELGAQGAFGTRDLDGDGLGELVASINPIPGSSGRTDLIVISSAVAAASGTSAGPVATITGFNTLLESAGDLNRDGIPDAIGRGVVLSCNPPTAGTTLFTATNPATAPVGDVNGDGYPDLGDVRFAPSPQIILGNGAGVIPIPSPIAASSTIQNVGDIDGDDFDDVALHNSNLIEVFSPQTGQTLLSLDLIDPVRRVMGLGDVDGDNRDEFMFERTLFAGGPSFFSVVSGATGTVIQTVTASGSAVSASPIGDATGDGLADLLVATRATPTGSLRLEIFDLGFASTGTGTSVVTGAPCPTAIPTLPGISASGRAVEGRTLRIHAAGGVPGTAGTLMFGPPAIIPLAPFLPLSTCVLQLAPTVNIPVAYDANGAGTVDIPVPTGSGLVGQTVNFQFVFPEPMTPPFVLSEALQVVVGI